MTYVARVESDAARANRGVELFVVELERPFMSYRSWLKAAGLVLVLCASGCMQMRSPHRQVGFGRSPAGSASFAGAGMRSYRIANAVIAPLPHSPQSQSSRSRARDGGIVTTTSAEAELRFPNMYFRVFVAEFEGGISGDLTDQLDELVDYFIEGSDGAEVREARPITTRGFPGVELELYNEEERTTLRVRHYIGRRRAYTIIAAYKDAAQMQARVDAELARFFDNVQLDAADAPVPAGDGRYDAEAWTTIFPPEDDFAIAMPGRASTSNVPFELATDGQETTVYRVAGENATVRFEVHVTPLRGIEPEGLLERMRDRRLTQGYHTRDARDVQRQGYAGMAVAQASATEIVYSVYVVTMSRLYEARVVAPLGMDQAIVPHRQRFLQSWRIL